MVEEKNSKIFIAIIIVLFTAFMYGEQQGWNSSPDAQAVVNCEQEAPFQPSLVSLLGKNFSEIEVLLGEPHQVGFSHDYGPHNYLQYSCDSGSVRFCSPEGLEKKTVVSIIVSGELDVLDVQVGMTFAEIQAVLGASDYGPEYGMDDTFYMFYIFDDHEDLSDPFTVTFSAQGQEEPTYEAFIKWEAFDALGLEYI